MTETPHDYHAADHQRIEELRLRYEQLGSAQPSEDELREVWVNARDLATPDSKRSLLLSSHVALDLAHTLPSGLSEARALAHRVRNYLQDWSEGPMTHADSHSPDILRFPLVRAFLGKQFVLFDPEFRNLKKIQGAEQRVGDKLRDTIQHPNFWGTMPVTPAGSVHPTPGHQALVTHLLVTRHNARTKHISVHSWPSFLRQEKARDGWDLSVSNEGFYAEDAVRVKFTETKSESVEGVKHVSMEDWGMPVHRVAGMFAHEAKVRRNLEALRRGPVVEQTKFAALQVRLDAYGQNALSQLGVL